MTDEKKIVSCCGSEVKTSAVELAPDLYDALFLEAERTGESFDQVVARLLRATDEYFAYVGASGPG